MIWQAKDGERVRDAMKLTAKQREMTLRNYRRQKACNGCGKSDVPVYDGEDGLICALCDGKSERRAS